MKVFCEFLRQLFVFVFVAQTAFWPPAAAAGRKLASVRGAGADFAKNPQLPNPKEFIDLTRQAALGAYGRLIERNSSPKELTAFLLSAMTAKDREEMAPILGKLVIPETTRLQARRVGDALEISADGFDKVVVRWPKFPQNTLNINGIDWTVSAHQSIRFNLELLMARLAPPDKKNKPSSVMRQLFLPEANASIFGKVANWLERHRATTVATIVGTVIVGNIVNSLWNAGYNFICSHAHQINDFWSSSCNTFLENLKKSRDLRGEVAKIQTDLPSKKGKIDGQGETEEKWSANNGKSCPHDKERTYIADVILTRTINGVIKPMTPWYTVRAELDSDTNKKIQFAVIAPRGTDMTAPGEREEKAHAIFHIDATSGKQMIDIRNQDSKKSTDPMVTIPVDVDQSKLSPKENTENKQWQEFVRQLAFLVEACRAELNLKKLAEEEKKKEDAGQPSAIPKEDPPEAAQPRAPPAEAPAKSVQ